MHERDGRPILKAMCETCDLRSLCTPARRVRIGSSSIMMGDLTPTRATLCVRERGVELQRIIIARSGLWALLEFVASALCLQL